ncbi:hypothetical protein CICLE_v10029376mg [Citrus x clementina]|uniref:Uncharacterized protein n=2 Tax=Citrus TaxID=2706 RepID=A0ACB8IQP9_CITSI|nr:hypothetical protein CICLE_v10029376mg [Citrus x clementina]KAH9699392.1 hypothetical protein KPL71_024324 [Citrus sinensis]
MNQTSEVPFSWENKPGVSKAITRQHQQQEQEQQHDYDGTSDGDGDKHSLFSKLPPPPCPEGSSGRFRTNKVLHDIQIPLPPCAFQPPPPPRPPSRSSSRKGLMMMNMMKHHDQDPFLVAFKECTKTSSSRKSTKLLPKNSYKGMFNFSCKRSCSVRHDNLVRVSQLPVKKDEEIYEEK